MPRPIRSQRGEKPERKTTEKERKFEPTQERAHVRCALCGLQSTQEAIAGGPYPVEIRTQRFGGSQRSPTGRMSSRAGNMEWSDPRPAGATVKKLVKKKLGEAIDSL